MDRFNNLFCCWFVAYFLGRVIVDFVDNEWFLLWLGFLQWTAAMYAANHVFPITQSEKA
jgi:hypothetical protein